MNLKKKIKARWSLEAKDDYSTLRKKVSFNEPMSKIRPLWTKGFVFSMSSVFVVILVMIVAANFLGFDSSLSPNDNYNEPESPVPPSNVPDDSDSDIDEGFTPEDGYLQKPNSGLGSLDIPFFYNNKIYSAILKDEVGIQNVDKFKEVMEFLDKIRYEAITPPLLGDFEIKDDSIVLIKSSLIINNGELVIEFYNSNVISFLFSGGRKDYKVNIDNVKEELLKIIK